MFEYLVGQFVAGVLVPLMWKGGHFSMQMEMVYIQRVMFKVPERVWV